MPMGDPRLVAFRVGAVLLGLAALSIVPAGFAARIAPLGRASLGVYAVHVPIVYGWSGHDGLAARVGATLSFGEATGVAIAVLAASFAVFAAARGVWRGTVKLVRWGIASLPREGRGRRSGSRARVSAVFTGGT